MDADNAALKTGVARLNMFNPTVNRNVLLPDPNEMPCMPGGPLFFIYHKAPSGSMVLNVSALYSDDRGTQLVGQVARGDLCTAVISRADDGGGPDGLGTRTWHLICKVVVGASTGSSTTPTPSTTVPTTTVVMTTTMMGTGTTTLMMGILSDTAGTESEEMTTTTTEEDTTGRMTTPMGMTQSTGTGSFSKFSETYP